MTFNKIPLAIGFDSATGNASGLTEFTLNLSDVGDVCTAIPDVGQVLAYSSNGFWCASTIPTGGGGGGSTQNLAYISSDTQGTITITGGDSAVIPDVDSTNAGLMIPADKTLLDTVETGAEPTNATTVAAAGAIMDSDNLNAINDVDYSTAPDGTILTRQNGFWKAVRLDLAQINLADGSEDFGGNSVKLDHGALSGLGDDDHTQYVLSAGTRAMTELTVNNNISTSGIIAKNIVPNSEDGLNIRAVNISGTTSVSSASITGTNVTANELSLSGDLNIPDYTSLTGAGIPMVLHRQVGAPVASSNSTSLAELVSFTLPANSLAIGDIDIRIRGRQLAQGSNLRWNFKIGGTNILNSNISQGTFSDMTVYNMHIQISKTETDKQLVTANFTQSTGSSSAAGKGSWAGTHRVGQITNDGVTADESTALALSLEAQQANSAQIVTVDQFRVTLIPDPA